MWVKVCGVTSIDAVEAACEAGADAIGFVFAPSVRQMTAKHAAELVGAVRGRVQIVAVTRHPVPSEWLRIDAEFAPDMLQTDLADLAQLPLRERLQTLPVVRSGAAAASALPTRILYEGPRSGSGQRANWHEAAQLARRTELVLAGGIDAASVAEAIRAVRPWGVDASSGLEQSPGVKTPRKIFDYVRAARAAAAELQ